jgi:hypothetical protein
LAAIGAKKTRIEIGTAVIDIRYDSTNRASVVKLASIVDVGIPNLWLPEGAVYPPA